MAEPHRQDPGRHAQVCHLRRLRWVAALALLAAWVGLVVVPEAGGSERAENTESTKSGKETGGSSGFDEVRSILSDNCFLCHGPDENRRRADLRLDTREGLFEDLGGYAAVVPGDLEESELYFRITTDDRWDRMPPRNSGKTLSPEEIRRIGTWIEDGARWEEHWSYTPPVRPPVPEVSDASFVVNAVDRFILSRLEQEGLRPAPPADRRTLARRLHLDLLGLPPSPEDVDAFAGDSGPDALEQLVDRLLASPHYGERMAVYWLDLVRYADTTGYHGDNHRDIWAYRDWVVKAFNENLPFDRFTLEQLAGDLLEGSTTEQKLASGYNRLNMTTQEGGAQPGEYVAKYAADRVRNASSVWMGATMGCAECHDHKYDPYTSRDFYRFAAFFADVKEMPIGEPGPGFPLPSAAQKAEMAGLDASIAELKAKLESLPAADDSRSDGEAEAEGGEAGGSEAEAASPEAKAAARAIEALREKLAAAEKAKEELRKKIPTTMITTAVKPRTVRILPRGNWMDDSGDVVQPGVPHFLEQLEVGDRRATRLDLARWLVAPGNPLTARVFVNRLWKLFFGRGLARNLDDLGAQGAPPTHPELLDWLAVEFVESGWDVRRMVKLLVLSGTYRQSSLAGPELRARDPYNELLARQGRWRLDGELVRDAALKISGLLSPRLGGPSVKPPQPEGYWSHLNFPKRKYRQGHGESVYRRGLYIYWQRTFLYPSLLAFDAPTREHCTAERARSNTPLQALVLLNDPVFVEAARVFAARILCEGGGEISDRIRWAYREALAREPTGEEADLVTALLEKHYERYASDSEAAGKLVGTGETPVPESVDLVELAAWTSVARVILNLHETITRS